MDNKKIKTGLKKQVWKAGNMLNPTPAVMVSCQREGEKANIITLAWAGTICSDPAMVSVSIRPERHSYDIIKETGEFVITFTLNPESGYTTTNISDMYIRIGVANGMFPSGYIPATVTITKRTE